MKRFYSHDVKIVGFDFCVHIMKLINSKKIVYLYNYFMMHNYQTLI